MVGTGVAPTHWHHVLGRLLFAIFLCELGIFLIVYPWLDAWSINRFATFAGDSLATATFADFWRRMWISPYFRGAISGLGVVNIYISLLEVVSMRRRRVDIPDTDAAEDCSGDPVE
ncbi:MAG: hypothetical protein ABI972_00920 [Acidobacteriota bacterium]